MVKSPSQFPDWRPFFSQFKAAQLVIIKALLDVANLSEEAKAIRAVIRVLDDSKKKGWENPSTPPDRWLWNWWLSRTADVRSEMGSSRQRAIARAERREFLGWYLRDEGGIRDEDANAIQDYADERLKGKGQMDRFFKAYHIWKKNGESFPKTP